ncbi:MAG: ATP-binding cassette domain-containing protein [Thaumarchaeota archaeon]|jgi:peptide/nickel transport system ATP-binding protein|nr:ATP-binding cassette domain-containing protein [Candidatus Terraquivivens yellowstonensis]
MSAILTVDNLKLYYRTRRGIVKAVNNVSLQLERGKTLAVVGESGCGKSSLAYALIRILPRNVHEYSGVIKINGVDVLKLSEEDIHCSSGGYELAESSTQSW